ncbi:MAG: hypothetical protein IJY87_04645 [Bacilli bacterium]|nr:hypothetical protein [Bacilli bacterium]MBQ8902336.1 hypothetical protein [Bacilli bacterium]
MDKLNDLLQELGVSKVRLSKYLGVSRQMVYNYLVLDSLDKWPKEKKILLLQLLDLKEGSQEELANIKVDTEYLMNVEKRLNIGVKNGNDLENFLDLKGLDKESRILLNDIAFLLKEKLEENKNNDLSAIKYLYNLLQSMDNVPEIKYILAYMAKTNGFINSEEFAFNEDKQFIFEGILYSALTLYNNGGASKSKVTETRKRFVEEIEAKKEEKLSRTQQLNTTKIQALKELGYTEINEANAAEVFEKIAEIQSRKV